MAFNGHKTSSVSLCPVCCDFVTRTLMVIALLWLSQVPSYPYSCTELSKVITVIIIISTNLEGMHLPLVICLSEASQIS